MIIYLKDFQKKEHRKK